MRLCLCIILPRSLRPRCACTIVPESRSDDPRMSPWIRFGFPHGILINERNVECGYARSAAMRADHLFIVYRPVRGLQRHRLKPSMSREQALPYSWPIDRPVLRSPGDNPEPSQVQEGPKLFKKAATDNVSCARNCGDVDFAEV